MSNIEAIRHATKGEWKFNGNAITVNSQTIGIALRKQDAVIMSAAKHLLKLLDRVMVEADEAYGDGIPLPGWYEEAQELVADLQDGIEGIDDKR